MTVALAVFGIIGTGFMKGIGLPPILFPISLGILAILAAIGKQGDQHLSKQQWVLAIAGAAAVSFLLAILITPSDNEEPAANGGDSMAPETKQTPPPAQPDRPIATTESQIIQTSIDELLAAYEANQVAAAKKFGNAPIQVSGKVVRVREALGTGFLVLKSTTSGQTHEFGFSDEGTKKLGSLNPGDQVSIICPTVWEAMSIVMVGGCSDVEVR